MPGMILLKKMQAMDKMLSINQVLDLLQQLESFLTNKHIDL